MTKIHKSGMYSTVTRDKNKKERKRPLTPEEKQNIVNRIEEKVKIHKQVLLDPFGLLGREWTDEEIEQQKREPCNDDSSPVEQKLKSRKKLNLLCGHKQGVIKDGYAICMKCNYKWKVKNIKLEQKSVTAWLDLRNKAAHGEYSEYNENQVKQLIIGVRDFIVRNPA